MSEERPIIFIWMPDPAKGTIYARRQGERSHVEFVGPPYQEWADQETSPWNERIHDAMEGWHSSILHAGDQAVILPSHPDYDNVEKVMQQAEDFGDE